MKSACPREVDSIGRTTSFQAEGLQSAHSSPPKNHRPDPRRFSEASSPTRRITCPDLSRMIQLVSFGLPSSQLTGSARFSRDHMTRFACRKFGAPYQISFSIPTLRLTARRAALRISSAMRKVLCVGIRASPQRNSRDGLSTWMQRTARLAIRSTARMDRQRSSLPTRQATPVTPSCLMSRGTRPNETQSHLSSSTSPSEPNTCHVPFAFLQP